jgi:uncharacterized membrane protein YoaK (UPF0700 family)
MLAGIAGLFFFLIELAILVVTFAGVWCAYTKAGRPGWAAIIPIYNVIVMLDIAGKPLWWIVLFFIPIANFVVAVLTLVAFAEKYGKGAGFVVGMIFLPFIFWPLLGLGDAQYVGAPPAQGFSPIMPPYPPR